ncbi:MAG: hypothetical protein A2Z88_04780 [Omnitrophica WOR_2 bacterium GWA2_47_8]|nr:MAG: hypothetical protein A2Z88_04780 [Omnitrophica WOR_2 bacterium GWA2_47_8]
MKKLIIFFRIYWLQILTITLITLAIMGTIWYIYVSTVNYYALESFTRRQLSGQMAATLPMFIIAQVVAIIIMMAFQLYIMSGGTVASFNKKRLDGAKMDVKWADVIGMEEAKREAWEIVKLLKDRTLVKAIGGNIVKGTMFLGPPGCGKTYLAKAMATECGLPMLTASGSEFVAMFMGQGAARIKSLFSKARKVAELEGGCIIFIDEIDAFAQPRQMEKGYGATTSHNATINQFLTELDGLRHKENNIVVFAATNADENDLDPALMRSGRFDRKIFIDKPNAKEREALLKFYLTKVQSDGKIDIPYFAEKAQWFAPADINNMVREAGLLALRDNRKVINGEDLKAGLSRVISSVEKMGENKILSDKVNVKWEDVIGMSDVKEEAWEIVKLLKDRKLLKAIGGKIVKGIVMFGPPGCGKTYLAKAMATASGFPFISVPGSEFVGMYIGTGTARMKSIFDEARKVAKAEGGCIIFLDEIDSFARPRQADKGFGGIMDHNATINQFLTELDGLRQTENNIVVLAATNAKENELDPAILRAGRLERKIHVTLPTAEDRKELFAFYFSKVSTAPDVNPEKWARIAVGTTPSDIDNIVREAGLLAMRDNRDTITHKDLMLAYDRISIGALSREKHTEKSLRKTAYHESGHALLAYILHPSSEVIKATIRARKGALGYIWNRPVEELAINSPNRELWLIEIQIALGGYVAEKLMLGSTHSGVGGGPGSDFYRAMSIASMMVWNLGMGRSGIIGDFSALDDGQMSEKTREILDTDTQEILQTSLKKTTELLTQHKDLLSYFAEELIKKGDLEFDEIVAIFDKFGVKPATHSENKKTF